MARFQTCSLAKAGLLSLLIAVSAAQPLYAKSKSKPKPVMQEENYVSPGSDHRTTPLMIIRFNQRKVYFERSLYEAVERAVEVKPGVRFTLVSMVPGEEASSDTADRNAGKIVKALNDMGVPSSRIDVQRKTDNSVDTGEVHVFVK